MTKMFAGLCAAALVLGLSFTPTLTHAQEQGMEEAEQGMTGESDATEDSGSMEEPQKDAAEEAEESGSAGDISEATTQAECKKAGGKWKAKKEKCVEKKQKNRETKRKQ
jgi:hypothetical protein